MAGPDNTAIASELEARACRSTCSTDAHSVRALRNMRLAFATARRGWATAADVLNTRPLAGVLAATNGKR